MLPILVIELLYKFGVLDHESKQTVLEQMSFIIFPLCKRPLTLSGILFLIKEFVEYLHGLLVRNNSFTVELILTVSEPDNVVTLVIIRLALNADHRSLLLL
jgi:hypothetical protein